MSTVTGGDSTGRYLVGNSYPDNTGYQPTLIWHDGQVRQLDVPGENQTFTGVNSTGDAVGSSFIDGKRTAFAYVGGRLSKLGGVDADAFAINADGIIVGTANGHAVVWRSVSGMPVDLATPPGDWQGMARDIGDDGTIVGTLRSADSERAYVWRPDGSVSELPVPTVRGVVADASRAYAIRHGWAIGGAARMDASARQPNGKPAATPTDRVSVRWNIQTGEVQPMPDAGFYAGGVNAYGWVVGWDSKGDGVLVSDAGTLTLPPLRKPVQPSDNLAYTISDDGRTIAGQSVLGDAARTMRAVVWHCR
jgi:uncharacterized membrane protein